jgi:CubicO group peptidase (beta-lactamase class C family)
MRKITLLTILLALTSTSFCQENKAKQLDELFSFYQRQNLFNGSILIAQKGQILLNKGYGLQDVAHKVANDPKSIFQIYSVTKPFTSTVILKLVEENKLSLSDKLSKFYPNYPKGDSISIENLLNHTAGIYDYTRGNTMPDQTEKSFVEFHKAKPLDFPAGTNWSYSNSGYFFLGYIIQKVTGMSYENAVATYIFKPLQMKQSSFAFKNLKSVKKAVGYELFSAKRKKASIVYDPPGPFAAGGIYSTVEDLYKFYNGLKSNKIIAKTLLDKAYTPFKNNYGYGWVVIPMFDKVTVGHSGAGAGFRSNFVQIPEDEICIILLTNTERDLNNATSAALKVLYNKPYKIPTEISLTEDELKPYVGTYEVNKDFVIYVSFENNKLIAQPSKQPKSLLYPEKMNSFYVEELNGYIHFNKNALQEIDTLVFSKDGQSIKAKKVQASWGIVGSATVMGWEGPDIKLAETDIKGIWEVKRVQLKKGEMKFRFNNDWTINLGKDLDGKLMQEGNNFLITEGVYDIVLDASEAENLKYLITKRN